MKNRISVGALWLLALISGVTHVWQWQNSRRIEAESIERFNEERDRSNEFHVHCLTAEAFAKLERTELQSSVETLKDPGASSPLIQALGEDFCSKSQGYIIEIARKYVGTSDEPFGRDQAMWHAARLEACGLLPTGMTAQFYVDGTFKAARKQR